MPNSGTNTQATGTGNPTPITPPVDPNTWVELKTPYVQVSGGNVYKINLETTADQVKMSDGQPVSVRLSTLERTVSGQVQFRTAETITDRDNLVTAGVNLLPGDRCWVFDATGDTTVSSGGALYLYMSDATWLKIAEAEAMDIVCDWSHVENKPDSTVQQIDLAVAKQHTHDNKTELDQLTDDGANNLLYKGKRISDGLVWSCMVSNVTEIPANLADGGIVIINPAMAPSGSGAATGGGAAGGGGAGS